MEVLRIIVDKMPKTCEGCLMFGECVPYYIANENRWEHTGKCGKLVVEDDEIIDMIPDEYCILETE